MIKTHESQKMQNIGGHLDYKRKNIYKYEQGGMLVYDIKAELFKLPSNSIPLPLNADSMNQTIYESNYLNIQDTEILEKIKQLPPSPKFEVYYNLYIPDDSNTLTFNSKFESGNLLRAIKLSDYEYNLTIRSDMNSNGNNHWYYFSVMNPRKTPITFHIVNMKKCDGLYKLGMKPAVYSTKIFQNKKIGWHRDCMNVSYKLRPDSLTYYALTFTYSFKYENDLVYFAYAVPYTYTHLNDYLQSIQEQHSSILRIDTLCNSLANNACKFLTITNNVQSYKAYKAQESDSYQSFQNSRFNSIKEKRLQQKNKEHKMKKGIFLTARVHSGETVSSFTIQGCIDFLLSSSPIAVLLRNHFIFKIVPMLNPDGVRYGNYRCSLLGVDLNRRWNFPNKNKHPTVFYTKKLLQEFINERRVKLYCDFHGHTKKQNVFMYGCAESTNDVAEKRRNLCVKAFPVLMQNNKFFSFKDCHFAIHSSKISTARVVAYRELRILNSYTVEASFFGAKGKDGGPDVHMEPSDYASIGQTVCELLPMFLSKTIFFRKVKIASEYLLQPSDNFQRKDDLEDLQEASDLSTSDVSVLEETQWENIKIPEQESGSESSGSESSPEERQEFPIRNSKSTKKARVSPSSIYKSPERRALYTKIELKPLNLSKRYNSITKTSMIPKILEEPKPPNNIEKNIIKSKAASQYKLANRVNILLESPLKNTKQSPLTRVQPSGLPKISTENKISTKISPKGYNFINLSWIEDYSHSIFNSISVRK